MKQDKGSQVKAKFITTIAINAYIKKKKRSLKNYKFTLQGNRNRRKTWHKTSRRKEMTKIRAEINERATRKTIEKNQQN